MLDPISPDCNPHRPAIWLRAGLAFSLALVCALTLVDKNALAGTVTIQDGPGAAQGPNVYDDAYIATQLAGGSLIIDTAGAANDGPDDILIEAGVSITWTVGTTLTLRADRHIQHAGRIQHNGPADGGPADEQGGLWLRADADDDGTGDLVIGDGSQVGGVVAGSRNGMTRVTAHNVWIEGSGSTSGGYSQLGYHTLDQGGTFTATGAISVTATGVISLSAGAGGFAYSQIGHGGSNPLTSVSLIDGALLGEISLSCERLSITAGNGVSAYAHIGNGGRRARGTFGGDLRLEISGSGNLLAGGNRDAYVQIGNGGYQAVAAVLGDIRLRVDNELALTGGDRSASFVWVGNGGQAFRGDVSGSLHVRANDVVAQAGSGANTAVQIGNGSTAGTVHGDVTLMAGSDLDLLGGTGSGSYASLGNRGIHAISGTLDVEAGGNVALLGGDAGGSWAQFGHGGPSDAANAGALQTGVITLTTGSNLTMTAGSELSAYAMVGHGADNRAAPGQNQSGERHGHISVQVGATAILTRARIGHVNDGSQPLSTALYHTWLGVGENDPLPTSSGKLLVSGETRFNSAGDETTTDGLRIYLSRGDSQQIPLAASFNGKSLPAANTIPAEQLQAGYTFGTGPYTPPYSFYIRISADLVLGKRVTPAGEALLPGQPVTYTLSFANQGLLAADVARLHDSIPHALAQAAIDEVRVAPGVTVSQTSPGPDFAWTIGNLTPGAGGVITLTGVVSPQLNSDASLLNQAGITMTGEVTITNNVSSTESQVMLPRVHFNTTVYTATQMGSSSVSTITLILDRANPYLSTSVRILGEDGQAVDPSVDTVVTFPPGATSASAQLDLSGPSPIALTLTEPYGTGITLPFTAVVHLPLRLIFLPEIRK